MLRLALTAATATLVNFNPSTEKSGQDDIPFSALRISVAMGAEVLNYFAPGLKDFLFNEHAPRDLAEGLALRDPHMVFPLKRDEEMDNVFVSIDYGVDKPIALPESKLKDFQLTPNAGGTVVVAFTVICKPDAEKHVPKLYVLQRRGITITVTPAELATMAEAA